METKSANIIDVTILKPQLKHPTIFQKFDELSDGENLTIYNDHDPKPLYYQLLSERGDNFQWKYLEEGPERWVVNILKGKSASSETVGQIVAKDWRKAEVFRKFGIDFCCGGKKSLEEVCADKKVDYERLKKELQQVSGSGAQRPLPFNDWTPAFLVDYIVNTHHSFVRKTLPEIKRYAYKVATVHGDYHPELKEIHTLVQAIDEELTHHMAKEETILFPFIKELAVLETAAISNFGSVANPISVMEFEHDAAGKIMEEIRLRSSDYTIPSDACASYTLLYRMLDEFESDLHAHIHLENNILFPKALQLEKELRSGI